VKSEARRNAILETAAAVFLENGFDRASMSMIAERLGGSKATLYNYFKSKEELFLAVVDFEVESNAESILRAAEEIPDLRTRLVLIGTGYLMQRLSVRPTRYFRIISGQGEESEIGKYFWNNVLQPAWMLMCGRFEAMMEEGLLRKADPWVATMHFKGLMEQDLVERRLLGVLDGPDSDTCREVAQQGVDAFWRAYGPEQ
jgi:AcrR family transcriptional regulator